MQQAVSWTQLTLTSFPVLHNSVPYSRITVNTVPVGTVPSPVQYGIIFLSQTCQYGVSTQYYHSTVLYIIFQLAILQVSSPRSFTQFVHGQTSSNLIFVIQFGYRYHTRNLTRYSNHYLHHHNHSIATFSDKLQSG